VPATK